MRGRRRNSSAPRISNQRSLTGFTLVKNTLDETQTKHCIAEEATRALGFRAADVQAPSVFSTVDSGVTALSLDDKILVRTLYDKRIAVAMSEEDAMVIVPTIISELVAKLRTDGEKALYQR